MATYENLKKAQEDLKHELTAYNTKLAKATSVTGSQLAAAKLNLDKWLEQYNVNHASLISLAEQNPALKTRSYFTADQNEFQLLHTHVLTALNNLPLIQEHQFSSSPQHGANTSNEAVVRSLLNKINLLEARMNAQAESSSTGRQAPPTVQGMEARIIDLIQTMNEQKDPLTFPKFPSSDVIKCYREWRYAVRNYSRTNPSSDAVKIQHLKEACKGTEAEGIVSIFSIATDDFENVLQTLDKRFLISRRIITEYIEFMTSINPANSKANQSKHIKQVIDTFNAMQKNIESVVQESLIASGSLDLSMQMDPADVADLKQKALINGLYVGLLLRALDDFTKTQIATTLNFKTLEIANVDDIIAALEKKLAALHGSEKPKQDSKPKNFIAALAYNKPRTSYGSGRIVSQGGSYQNNKRHCVICVKDNHSTSVCNKLKNQNSFAEKIQLLKTNPEKIRICYRCLEQPFNVCNCSKQNKVCENCGDAHHKILCMKKVQYNAAVQQPPPRNPLQQPAQNKQNSSVNNLVVNNISLSGKVPVLGTLLVKAQRADGSFVVLRAFADDGSMVNVLSSRAAQLLACKTVKCCKTVTAYNGDELDPILEETELHLQDLDESLSDVFTLEKVSVTDKIPLILPTMNLSLNVSKKFRDSIKFADPNWMIPQGIDLLIGGPSWALAKTDGSKLINKARLQNSIFGFVVQGTADSVDGNVEPSLIVNTILSGDRVAGIRDDFKAVFEYEQAPDEDDNFSELLFREFHRRLPSGRYEVPLIFGVDKELGNSYNVCFMRNKKVLEKLDQKQTEQFLDVMREYQNSGIISVCNDEKGGTFYCPFVLVWTKKISTPLRICLDGSQKSSNHLSVNDIQMSGKKLQPNIVSQLLKFRQHPVAVISDISQMFLNIRVREEDRKYQRSIINIPNYGVQEIQYNTILFGATCGPYLAQRTMLQLAEDENKNFPIGAELLRRNIYIDDIIFSSETVDSAREAANQLLGITASAQFKIHKMASNFPDSLSEIPDLQRLEAVDESKLSTVLGIQWQRDDDEIFINLKFKPVTKLTKRIALSIVASIYDPLGLISPLVQPAKFLIQSMWLRDRELRALENAKTWDRVMPEDLDILFREWFENIQLANRITLNRFCGFDNSKQQALYIFCDASTKGYGCVAYLRTEVPNSKAIFSLIASKGKVAPVLPPRSDKIEALSIPRLELLATHLGANMACVIIEAWQLSKDYPLFVFTDSEICLAQISGSTIRDVFCERRLREIRAKVPRKHWAFVSTEENPADLISRGCSVNNLSELWLSGPPSMREPGYIPLNKFPIHEEVMIGSSMMLEDSVTEWKILLKYSSFYSTLRVLAFISKAAESFKNKVKEINPEVDVDEASKKKLKISATTDKTKAKDIMKKLVKQVSPLTSKNIEDARYFAVSTVQRFYYTKEIETLKSGQEVKNGALRFKNAFLDSNGIMRVGTRVQAVEFDYDERNPIVLPPITASNYDDNHISYQVIYDAHLDTIHGGLSLTMATIRQRYFIPGLRKGIKRHISLCQLCVRVRAKTRQQIMGNLPKEITIRSPAFSHITLDYAGPIILKSRARPARGQRIEDDVQRATYNRAWIMLVACFSTGAYHLEIVAGLSSNAFLNAFSCFIATRGFPVSVRSDNATCFHGAKGMLKEVFNKFQSSLLEGEEIIRNECAQKNVEWNFNPPLASHFGGKHERGIRSVREMMRKSVGVEKLNYWDLHYTVKRFEGILNSRPLIKARGVFEEGDFILTPGHFIIGRPINMLPSIIFPSPILSDIETYRTRTRIEDRFWQMFYKQHLQELAHRTRWPHSSENIKVGDLVCLKEDGNPPLNWRKGIVTQAIPGPDGKVRVVKVKTTFFTKRNGVETTVARMFERPITKIVLIPGGIKLNENVSLSGEMTTDVTSLDDAAVENEIDSGVEENETEQDKNGDDKNEKITDETAVSFPSSIPPSPVVLPIPLNPKKPVIVESPTETEKMPRFDHAAAQLRRSERVAKKNAKDNFEFDSFPHSKLSLKKQERRLDKKLDVLMADMERKKIAPVKKPSDGVLALRRSKRIASRNIIGSLFWLFLVLPTTFAQHQTLRVNSSQGGGAMIYEKEGILLSEGTFHIMLTTNLTAEIVAEDIMYRYNRFWSQCKKAFWDARIQCGSLLPQLKKHCVSAVERIEHVTGKNLSAIVIYFTEMERVDGDHYEIPESSLKEPSMRKLVRIKRYGWVWRFFEWAFSFGTNDANPDLKHDRSSGVVYHTINSIKNVEQAVVKHAAEVTNEFEALYKEIDYQASRGAEVDGNIVYTRLHIFHTNVIHYVNEVMISFNSHPIEDEELYELIRKVDIQVLAKGAQVPILPLDQLKSFITYDFLYNITLTIAVGFPLVSLDHFQRITIVPLPDMEKELIADFNITDVIVNMRNKWFLEISDAELSPINSSFSFMQARIIHKLQDDTRCAIRLAMLSNQECGVKRLPKDYEFWYITPLHNMVQFVSSKPKSLICQTNRIEITTNSGVIMIPPNCVLDTGSFMIKSNLDEVRSFKQMVKVNLENIDEMFNRSRIISHNFTRPIPTDLRIDDTKLNLLQKELLEDGIEGGFGNVNDGMNFLHIVLITINMIGFISVISAFTWLYLKVREKKNLKEDVKVHFHRVPRQDNLEAQNDSENTYGSLQFIATK